MIKNLGAKRGKQTPVRPRTQTREIPNEVLEETIISSNDVLGACSGTPRPSDSQHHRRRVGLAGGFVLLQLVARKYFSTTVLSSA